jgi:broad specificity phosphatase PhoE
MSAKDLPINSAAAALIGDPAKYGRVDEAGMVYVQTSDGERVVGSYPGKTPEEALAYFVRKFEVVAAEVALLAARIVSGAMVPDSALQAVNKLRNQVEHLNGVGNIAALKSSLEQIPSLIDEHRSAYEAKRHAEMEAKAAKRAAALEGKEKIVIEAESLKDSEQWKATGDRLKDLLEEWKKAPRLDKKSDTELWKRFSAARNHFDKKRRTHFASLSKKQNEVKSAKEKIVQEAEALANSTDWVATARRYKALMDQWKASGRGKKNEDAKLWERFKAAQDTFFAAKNSDLEKRSESFAENLVKKEALVSEIEALLPIANLDDAKRKFRDLKSKYAKAGMVERNKKAQLDRKIENVELSLKEAEQEQWRRTDPGAKSRALEVVNQLIAAVADYEAKAARADAAGDARKAAELREAASARSIWLAEAQRGLAEFSS